MDRPGRAAWAIAPGAMLAGVAGGIAFPILPIAGAKAGLPLPFIGAILAANRAARVIANPLTGALTDRIGGRRTLIVGLVLQIAVMGLYWLGVVTGHPGVFFLAGRLLHGPASSCVFVAGQALALHAGGTEHGGSTSASVRAAMATGVPLGLVAGGFLSDTIGDADTFVIASGAIALATIAAFYMLPDLRVTVARRAGLGESLKALFEPTLGALGSLNFAATFAGSGMVLTTTVLLVKARGIGVFGLAERATAGFFMGWLVGVEALSMPLFGRLGDRKKLHGWIAAAGMTLIVPALVVIAQAHTTVTILAGFAMLGVGVGGLGPSVIALVGRTVAPERRGLAVGVLQVAGDLGGALGPLVGTALFASSIAMPYYASAVVVALFVPVAVWLARATSRPPREE